MPFQTTFSSSFDYLSDILHVFGSCVDSEVMFHKTNNHLQVIGRASENKTYNKKITYMNIDTGYREEGKSETPGGLGARYSMIDVEAVNSPEAEE